MFSWQTPTSMYGSEWVASSSIRRNSTIERHTATHMSQKTWYGCTARQFHWDSRRNCIVLGLVHFASSVRSQILCTGCITCRQDGSPWWFLLIHSSPAPQTCKSLTPFITQTQPRTTTPHLAPPPCTNLKFLLATLAVSAQPPTNMGPLSLINSGRISSK